MKISYPFLYLLLIIAFLFVIPTFCYNFFKTQIRMNINDFEYKNEEIKKIFRQQTTNLYPKINKNFNVEDLVNLGKLLNLDFTETGKKINEPYGSYWIDYALFQSISKAVTDLKDKIMKINGEISLIKGISILIGIILTFVIFASIKNKKETLILTLHGVLPLMISILIWSLILYFIFIKAHYIFPIIKNSIQNQYNLRKFFSNVLCFRAIIIFLQILLLFVISILILKTRKAILPVVAIIILINLFIQPKALYSHYNYIKSESRQIISQKIKKNIYKILAEIRQKSKKGKMIKNYAIYDKFANYNVKSYQDSIIISIEKKFIGEEERKTSDLIFYPKLDSVYIPKL